MPDETTPSDNSSVNATINAVAGLAQAIPVYQDALQPAAKEVGKSLEVVAKVVGIALAPLKGVVWGYERIEKFLTESIGKKLENVPEEAIITPPVNVAGPAVEALKFAGEDTKLRELYANLITNAMDKRTEKDVHPSFVEVIKSITGIEALFINKIYTEGSLPLLDIRAQEGSTPGENYLVLFLNYNTFAKDLGLTAEMNLISSYLDNLCRLGICEIPQGSALFDNEHYSILEADAYNFKQMQAMIYPEKEIVSLRKMIRITHFGRKFAKSVITDKL